MESRTPLPPPDPARFQPYHEPFRTTLLRTGLIALALGSIGSIVHQGRLPAGRTDVYAWMVLVLCVLWFSLGGHWVELAYLNCLRPRIAKWPDHVLVWVRIGTWLLGGSVLALGIVTTYGLLMVGQMPGTGLLRRALFLGGPVFAVIELVPHTLLTALGRPSFWNRRG